MAIIVRYCPIVSGSITWLPTGPCPERWTSVIVRNAGNEHSVGTRGIGRVQQRRDAVLTDVSKEPDTLVIILIIKGKSVPLQAWSGPEGSRKLRFPDFMTTAQDVCKFVSLMQRPPLPP